MTIIRRPVSERILEGSIPEPNSGCWLWTRALTNSGYGQLTVFSGSALAHRQSYEAFRGAIPDGLHLDHKCRVRICVNPDHLEPVTVAENNRRAPRAHTKKTHCKRGHALTEGNIYFYKGGAVRMCKECTKIRAQTGKNK